MRSPPTKIFGIASAIAVIFAICAIGVISASYPGYPALNSSGPANPADVAAIKATMERSYWLDGIAARTFDVSQFASVYINDPSVQLSQDEADFIARVRSEQPGATQGDGFLAYKLAFYQKWQSGADKLEQLQATATAEGRLVTAAELQSLSTSMDGSLPPPRRTDPMYQTRLRFDSVVTDGNRAEVVYDDGAASQRAFLVNTSGGWRIAGRQILNVHF